MLPEVLAAVTGRIYASEPASLEGYSRYRLKRRVYPGIVPNDQGTVQGVLYPGIDASCMLLIDAFESTLYERRAVSIITGTGVQTTAWAYVIAPEHAVRLCTEAWDLEHFRRRHLAAYLAKI
jgi:gamma-glutamylcyclotransferase (GGCT)/AIG2-like uncharacterized protein YtfP